MNHTKVYYTWLMLKVTYALVPILIGVDKLIGWWLVDWSQYTSPWVLQFIPLSMMNFVIATAVIEIVAGIFVWISPRWGAYLVAAWMILVVIDLASMNMYYDIIARDLVIAIGALALAWLSEARES